MVGGSGGDGRDLIVDGAPVEVSQIKEIKGANNFYNHLDDKVKDPKRRGVGSSIIIDVRTTELSISEVTRTLERVKAGQHFKSTPAFVTVYSRQGRVRLNKITLSVTTD